MGLYSSITTSKNYLNEKRYHRKLTSFKLVLKREKKTKIDFVKNKRNVKPTNNSMLSVMLLFSRMSTVHSKKS